VNAILAVASLVIKELYRRKDFYVLFVLTALITLVMGALNFFNDDLVVRYLKEVCLLLIWISALVIAITTTARQIPSERENRTIFPLLAKPLTRGHLVTGKFLGCWVATGLALVVFYLFFGLISYSREHVWPLVSYGQALWLHWVMLGVVIAMALCGSVIFAAPSSNTTILLVVVVGILLIGRYLNKVALQMDQPLQTIVYAIYFLIPHLELFDVRDLVIHNWEPIPWWACLGATLYAAVYGAFFLFAGWLVFRRQSLG
jgi:ABC-type transport system involved in multi-copper enzyme maturation permease subunit